MSLSIIASIFGIITVVAGAIGAIFGHRAGSKDKAQEVALAKETTAADVRRQVAEETAAAATQASANASASRDVSDADARTTAAHGDDALDAALKAQGGLRD